MNAGSESARAGTDRASNASLIPGTPGSRDATMKSSSGTTRGSESARSGNASDELCLFMLNLKASNPLLSIRKLAPQDLLFRVYFKAVEAFKHDGEERSKVLFSRSSEVEKFLKSKCSYY